LRSAINKQKQKRKNGGVGIIKYISYRAVYSPHVVVGCAPLPIFTTGRMQMTLAADYRQLSWFFLVLYNVAWRLFFDSSTEGDEEGRREGGQHHREKVVRVIKKTSIRVYVIAVNRLQYAEKKIFESKKENQKKNGNNVSPFRADWLVIISLKNGKRKNTKRKKKKKKKGLASLTVANERKKTALACIRVCVLRVCDGIRGWMEQTGSLPSLCV
jgi:hypothetical protein